MHTRAYGTFVASQQKDQRKRKNRTSTRGRCSIATGRKTRYTASAGTITHRDARLTGTTHSHKKWIPVQLTPITEDIPIKGGAIRCRLRPGHKTRAGSIPALFATNNRYLYLYVVCPLTKGKCTKVWKIHLTIAQRRPHATYSRYTPQEAAPHNRLRDEPPREKLTGTPLLISIKITRKTVMHVL